MSTELKEFRTKTGNPDHDDSEMGQSESESFVSEMNDTDHDEVHKTFRHRGKVLRRWKRLVKVNSTLYLLTSLACLGYSMVFASTHHTHNMGICVAGIVASIFGLFTTLSSKDPSPLRIYIGAIVTGLATCAISLYVIVGLSMIVIQSVDYAYEDQYDNFSFREIAMMYALGFFFILFSLSTFITHIRLYVVSEEKKSLALLIHSYKCYTFLKDGSK
ncbi:unnamed protein product [Moneuplotes crassus]|uniref:Uncharacterized protein n=1 Tax=Euplotes crassus TaxID=5936 RepID=A0AAD1XKI0_EUPCR|nr:unnamed protein product [Moneuplotes crassus]